MNSKPTTDRSITFAVTASLWLLLILLQTLVTPLVSQGIDSVFTRPSLYYSTWLTDLYLILLFYLNYYSFAPQLMRRRLFRAYIWLLAVAALIGLLIPILCYSLCDRLRSGHHDRASYTGTTGVGCPGGREPYPTSGTREPEAGDREPTPGTERAEAGRKHPRHHPTLHTTGDTTRANT